MNSAPIAIYDSGLGGLTVWREVRRALPGESLLYLGDGKNCPYGSRPREEIVRLADEAVAALVARGCKLVVVACNTATAAAIDFLRGKYAPMPIVGMEPAVKPACLATRSGVVGVLATERSLDGDLFRRTAALYGKGIEVVTAPGRGFVELVESADMHHHVVLPFLHFVPPPVQTSCPDSLFCVYVPEFVLFFSRHPSSPPVPILS